MDRLGETAMNAAPVLFLCAGLFLALWLAYRIGKVILRVVAGLAFLGLIAFALYHFLLR